MQAGGKARARPLGNKFGYIGWRAHTDYDFDGAICIVSARHKLGQRADVTHIVGSREWEHRR